MASLSVRTGSAGLIGAIACGAVAVVVLWFQNTTFQLHAATDYAIAAGRLSGLLAGYAAIVLIALMARIPPLERSVGADRLTRWHASGGRYLVLLVVVHGISVAWGYARSARVPLVREVPILLRDYPDVLLASISGALLTLIGIASVHAARRAIGYQAWYLLHLLTYVAIALAFSHQFADGTDFIHDPAARIAWICLYSCVGALLVYYRVVRPCVAGVRRGLTVFSVVPEPSGLVSIVVHGRNVSRFGAEAGHFFRLRFLTWRLWSQSHPFSLSAPPGPGGLRFTVKPIGDHTRSLQHITPGTRVLAEGPFGTLTAARRRRRKVLLIAGGIGVAPLRALFESMPAEPGDLTLIYRCRTERELAFRSELDAIARDRDVAVEYLVGRSSDLDAPLGAASLLRLVPDLASHDVFLCAPPAMMSEVIATMRQIGLPARNIHWESFDPIGTPATARRRATAAALLSLGFAAALGSRSGLLGPGGIAPIVAADTVPVDGPAATHPGERVSGEHGSGLVTVAGSLERTLFCSVQVQAVLRDGRLVDVRAVELPNTSERSRQLSAMSAPILRAEAIRAGDAHIDSVSGATYTSSAYAQSLQAALDRAAR